MKQPDSTHRTRSLDAFGNNFPLAIKSVEHGLSKPGVMLWALLRCAYPDRETVCVAFGHEFFRGGW